MTRIHIPITTTEWNERIGEVIEETEGERWGGFDFGIVCTESGSLNFAEVDKLNPIELAKEVRNLRMTEGCISHRLRVLTLTSRTMMAQQTRIYLSQGESLSEAKNRVIMSDEWEELMCHRMAYLEDRDTVREWIEYMTNLIHIKSRAN